MFCRMKLDSDVEVRSISSSGSSARQMLLGSRDCLFCHESFADVETNVTHMSRKHSFFIPELTYLIDLDGLLTYLGKLIFN